MRDLVLVGIGGVVGAISRFVTGRWLTNACPLPGHIATLVINAAGSLVLGFVVARAAGGGRLARWEMLLTAGFCGSYTTFSSWVLDILSLAERASLAAAATHALVGVLVGVVALAAGVFLARHWPVAFHLEALTSALGISRLAR